MSISWVSHCGHNVHSSKWHCYKGWPEANTPIFLWSRILTLIHDDHWLGDLFKPMCAQPEKVSFPIHSTASGQLQARASADNLMLKEGRMPWGWHAVSSIDTAQCALLAHRSILSCTLVASGCRVQELLLKAFSWKLFLWCELICESIRIPQACSWFYFTSTVKKNNVR